MVQPQVNCRTAHVDDGTESSFTLESVGVGAVSFEGCNDASTVERVNPRNEKGYAYV